MNKFTQLKKDLAMLKEIDQSCKEDYNEDYAERRLTLEELGQVIHAGINDLEFIFSSNTKSWWIYSNAIDAYCDMDFDDWDLKTEDDVRKLCERGEHLYPALGWVFGEIDL